MDDSKYEKQVATDYRTLSDLDFVRNLDLLASKYYPDYMQGRAQITGSVDSFMSRTAADDCVAPVYPLLPPRTVEYRGYFVRRPFFLFLTLVCFFAEILYAVLSLLPIAALMEKLPLFGYGGDVFFFDPIKALFGASSPASCFFEGRVSERIPAYAMCFCLILFAAVAVVSFVLCISAMAAKKRKNGTYARYRFDVGGILQFVAVACFIVLSVAVGVREVGMGSVLLGVLSVLVFLFGKLSYKKVTVLVPETAINYDGRIKDGFCYDAHIKK